MPNRTERIDLLVWSLGNSYVAVRVPLTHERVTDALDTLAGMDMHSEVVRSVDEAAEVVVFHAKPPPGAKALFPPGEAPAYDVVPSAPVTRTLIYDPDHPQTSWAARLDGVEATDPTGAALAETVETWRVDAQDLAVAGLLVAPQAAVPEAFRRLAQLSARRALRVLREGLDFYVDGERQVVREIAPLLTDRALEPLLASPDRTVRQAVIAELSEIRNGLRGIRPSSGKEPKLDR